MHWVHIRILLVPFNCYKMKPLINSGYKLFFVVFIFLPFQLKATSPDAPYNLRSFDKYNPVGTDNKPYFGWYVNDPDDNEIQTAYQILITSTLSNLNADNGDIWNSGKVSSRKQNYVQSEGKPLSSASRYYWKVRTWDKDGYVSPYSVTATFETGLLTNSDWAGAKWIKRNSNDEDDYTYFRKKTTLISLVRCKHICNSHQPTLIPKIAKELTPQIPLLNFKIFLPPLD